MEFAVRQSSTSHGLKSASAQRCSVCFERALVLHRRHVSPERWGEPVVTEFYEWYSPKDQRWRRLTV
jgi:hypothetical protein